MGSMKQSAAMLERRMFVLPRAAIREQNIGFVSRQHEGWFDNMAIHLLPKHKWNHLAQTQLPTSWLAGGLSEGRVEIHLYKLTK